LLKLDIRTNKTGFQFASTPRLGGVQQHLVTMISHDSCIKPPFVVFDSRQTSQTSVFLIGAEEP